MKKYLLTGLLLSSSCFAWAADPRCASATVITHIDQELNRFLPQIQEAKNNLSVRIREYARQTGQTEVSVRQVYDQRWKNDAVMSEIDKQLFKLSEKLRVDIPIDLSLAQPANCDAFLKQVDADLKQVGTLLQQAMVRDKLIMGELFKP